MPLPTGPFRSISPLHKAHFSFDYSISLFIFNIILLEFIKTFVHYNDIWVFGYRITALNRYLLKQVKANTYTL